VHSPWLPHGGRRVEAEASRTRQEMDKDARGSERNAREAKAAGPQSVQGTRLDTVKP
jgi:hypothetical protein